MKVLLIGEYSNVHWTLAEGLRALGHQVTVVSDGDLWKDYPRDINLKRNSLGSLDTMHYLLRLERILPQMKGYDVVQLINPIFFDLKAERMWRYYSILRRNNRRVFLGAFGMDHYWVKAGLDCKTFRYSDFNMGSEQRHSAEIDFMIKDWLSGPKKEINSFIAHDCSGIISGLYEYHMSYLPEYAKKLQFIPFPIRLPDITPSPEIPSPIRFFIGIQKTRNEYKGTDIMLRALERLKQEYPEKVVIKRAENITFSLYETMLDDSDVLLDQLYSYTPAMNGLLAMSRGLILVGGGEPEHYKLLGESELRPIINVLPSMEDVYCKLLALVLNPERIPQLKRDSIEYIRRHHEYKKVAQQYVDFWSKT